MDSFNRRAVSILETAQMGTTASMTVLFGRDGGLRLIMDEEVGRSLPETDACAPGTAAYRLTRCGNRVRVSGIDGGKSCFFEGNVTPARSALLLDNQATYLVVPAMAALPPASVC